MSHIYRNNSDRKLYLLYRVSPMKFTGSYYEAEDSMSIITMSNGESICVLGSYRAIDDLLQMVV